MHFEKPNTGMLGQEGDSGNKEFPRSSGTRTSQSNVTWVTLEYLQGEIWMNGAFINSCNTGQEKCSLASASFLFWMLSPEQPELGSPLAVEVTLRGGSGLS